MHAANHAGKRLSSRTFREPHESIEYAATPMLNCLYSSIVPKRVLICTCAIPNTYLSSIDLQVPRVVPV
jgi:hypothetical protein